MKKIILLFPLLLVLINGCHTPADLNQLLEDMQENLDYGNFSAVFQLADSLKSIGNENKEILHISDSLKEIAERTSIDFSVSEREVLSQIQKLIGPSAPNMVSGWEKKGWLEWKMINGEKRYFKRAVSNLLLLIKFNNNRETRLNEIANEPEMIFRLKHTEAVIEKSDGHNNPLLPVRMKITYEINVHPDAVPAGENIRCWMPWPKESCLRQKEVKLLSTSNPEFVIAPDSAIHRSIYMEAISKSGIPVVFRVTYSYTSFAEYFKLEDTAIQPYDKNLSDYLKFTSEQLPHICFNDEIKKLADSICDKDDNPVSIVRKIYYWFKANIPWTGAIEYSIIPNIPEYVTLNRRGDCGMQTFLFMSMLRYKGIPVKWQSGWMVAPDAENIHDWCEVFYQGKGWVPVDVSYDLQKSEDKDVENFFMSGIDSYRLIVNDGIAGPLHPEKKFLRSEPYDFQRGEVEWAGGNLYFDKWDYNLKVEYLN